MESLKSNHRPSIKTVYAKLDRREPFTNGEKAKYNERERAFIRGIQLKDKEDKQQAIQTYEDYKIKGKKAVKKLASHVRGYIEDKYPKMGGVITHQVSDFKSPNYKSKIRRENKEQTYKFLVNRNNYLKNPSTYMRVKKGLQKYPSASLGELRHGVNSQWSQNYRLKHGLNRDYK